MRRFSRRQFLTGSAASLAALSVGPKFLFAKQKPKPNPKHIIVVTMENRSFDHVLGWLPGANGRQAGLVYKDRNEIEHPTHPLAPDFQGCSFHDPDHSWDGGRTEYNGGLCDGWLKAGSNDELCIGYYTQNDLSFLGQAAPDWTVCDNYFSAIMAPTYPNRIYMHSGVTDRIDNTLSPVTLPTIWDRLASKDLVGRYYFTDFPFLGLWGTKYAPIFRSVDNFLADCASGDLPHVGYVEPKFESGDNGTSGDDHPLSDIRAGETFLNKIYNAVTRSPAWKHTVLVVTFDEWGGFFEHVPPQEAPDVDPRYRLRGFRVPSLLISPFAKRSTVATGLYDHTSILKMIEWRWDLPALSVRDANANNLADELDFSSANLSAPSYSVPEVVSQSCP
jgi:phospholipase C